MSFEEIGFLENLLALGTTSRRWFVNSLWFLLALLQQLGHPYQWKDPLATLE
jgi:hypothetical protein